MREGAIIPRSSFSAYGANSVHMKTRQLNQPCLCLCLGSEQMTMTLPFLRMILHFSHIGFTDGRTFILVPPVADIFPQQIQAPCERMLNYYSRIDTVFNKKFKAPRKISRCLKTAKLSLCLGLLLASPGDSAAGKVIWRDLHCYFVARKNLDVILSKLS